MKFINLLPPGLRRLFLYALCGGSGVVLDFATYAVLERAGVWYQAGQYCRLRARYQVLSFLLNRAITFGVMDAPVRRFASFAAVATLGYLISSAMLWVLVEQVRLDPSARQGCHARRGPRDPVLAQLLCHLPSRREVAPIPGNMMISEDPNVFDCIVVGGGFTGLAAAAELVRARQDSVAVVGARNSALGGLASEFDVGGHELEKFYHHWFTSDIHIMNIADQIGRR